MNVPSGYTALDLIGFTDRDDYSSIANYVKNDLVHYNGRVWKCLIDDTTGIAPIEGANWTVWIDEAAYLSGLADVTITNPANGQVIRYNSQSGKWENVGVDSTPTSGSANLVQSGGVATQLANKANSADLATVATSGDYQDLNNLPTLADVATTGQYSDLLGLPTIPTVNNGTLTLQINGVTVETFNANDSNNKTANFNVPTKTSDLTNDSNFVSDANYQHITVDSAFSDTSTNPVQNKVVNSLKETLTNELHDNINLCGTKNFYKCNLNAMTWHDITITKNGENDYTFNGTSSNTGTIFFANTAGAFTLKSGSYKPVLVVVSGTFATNNKGNATFTTQPVGTSTQYYKALLASAGTLVVDPFTVSDETQQYRGGIWYPTGVTFNNYRMKIMLVPASCTDYTYEPPAKTNQQLTQETTGLIDNQNVNGTKNRLNLNLSKIKAINNSGSWSNNVYTYRDVTFTLTVDENNNITKIVVNGTASAHAAFFLASRQGSDNSDLIAMLKANSYVPSLGAKISTNVGINMDFYSSLSSYLSTWHSPDNESAVTIPSNATIADIYFNVQSGNTANNVSVYPMISLESIYKVDQTFVPYAKTNRELTDVLSQKFAVVTGTLVNGNVTPSAPSGFTAENSVVISCMVKITDSRWYSAANGKIDTTNNTCAIYPSVWWDGNTGLRVINYVSDYVGRPYKLCLMRTDI